MAKILDTCYAQKSQQLQKLFSVTHLKKSLNMLNSSKQWIELLTFLFFSFAFATEMAMHWMKLVSTMITIVNPVSFVQLWRKVKSNQEIEFPQSEGKMDWFNIWEKSSFVSALPPRCLPWVLWSLWFCFLRIKTLWWQKCDCWRWTKHSITNHEPSAHENSVTRFQKIRNLRLKKNATAYCSRGIPKCFFVYRWTMSINHIGKCWCFLMFSCNPFLRGSR